MSRYQPQTLEQRIVEEWETEAQLLDEESVQLAQEFRETYSPAVAKRDPRLVARLQLGR